MAACLFLVSLIAILVFLYLLWTYSYWYRRGVPQRNPLHLFGGMNDFALSRVDYLTLYNRTYQKYSKCPFQGVYSFLAPNLFLCDPDLIKDVISRKFHMYPDTASQISKDLDPIFARDPFFQTGEEWKNSRTEFSMLLTPARLRLMHSKMVEASNSMVQHLKNLNHESGVGDGADVKNLAARYVTEVMIAVLLSGKAGCFEEESNVFLELAESVFEDTLERNLAMTCIIGAPHLAKLLKLRILPKKSADFLEKIIQAEALKRKDTDVLYDAVLDAVMNRMDETKDKDETTKAMVALIITFFIEGFESTSLVITFALLNLAKNTEIQEKLRRKIFELAPPGEKFPDDLVNDLPFLQNCVFESMRLHPPVTMLQRRTGEDNTLVAPTGEEFFVSKGTIVNLPIYGLHHDSRVFPNPDSFDPDRFLDEAQKRMFIAFGDGPRQCVGRRYSTQSVSTMLASILREFRIELSPKVKFPLQFASHPFFLYPAEKVYLRFVPL